MTGLSPHDPSDYTSGWSAGSPFAFDDADDFAGFDDTDTPAEVDAAFRSQRRIATGYFSVFAVVLVSSVGATTIGPWATSTRFGSAFTPAFLLAAVVLFVVFLVIALLAVSLADRVEEGMLGATTLPQVGDPDAK